MPCRTMSSPSLPCSMLTRFFFQAEDGIRDTSVTGVQTCALPISATGAGLGAAAARALAQLAKPGAATRGVSPRGAGLGGPAAVLGGAARAAAWAQPGDLCGWAALAAASLAAAAVRAAVLAIGARVDARACASFGAALGAPRADPASG